jgi:hypothetical protein
MRISAIWMAVLLLLLASLPCAAPLGPLPLITSIEPQSGRAGDVIIARGNDLGQETVAALYLTDGTIDTKAVIIEQSASSVKFKIPAGTKPGRQSLMVLTTGPDPRYIEEPVKITVEPDTTG